MNRRWLFLLLPLCLLLALFWVRRGGTTPPPPPDTTVTVVRGDLNGIVQANGSLVAARRAQLAFATAGVVAEHLVAIGDEVAAGSPLLRLDPEPLQRQVDEARAAVLAAEAALQGLTASPAEIEVAAAQLQAAQLALQVAEIALDELPEDEQGDSEEAVQVEQARAAFRQAEATLRRLVDGPTEAQRGGAEAQLTQVQLQLGQAEQALSLSTLTAPFTGTVTALLVQPGEQVAPSQPVAGLADVDSLQIEAEVDEVDVGRVEPGQRVTVTIDAFPQRPLPGEVVSIDPAPRIDRAATVYRTVIELGAHDLPLRLLMNADVEIISAEATDVLLIPLDAIRFSESQPFVVVQADGGTVPRDVTLGADDGRVVEVVSGVEEGEVLLLP